MAVEDYEFSWVVRSRDSFFLIGKNTTKKGRPKKSHKLQLRRRRVRDRRKRKKERARIKGFYERHPELSQPRHSDTPYPKDLADKQQQRSLEERYLIGPQNSDYIQRHNRRKRNRNDPYWNGFVFDYNGTKYFQWSYTARKLGRSPATFKHMTDKGVIPKCMYVLGSRNWLYYSEHQYKLLRYAMRKLGTGKGAWKREDAAKFLFENWTKNESLS